MRDERTACGLHRMHTLQTVVKRSLRTGDEALARARYPAVAAEFQEFWRQMRLGVQSLTPEECQAFAGEIYRDLMEIGAKAPWSAPFSNQSWERARNACKEVKENDTVNMGNKREPMRRVDFLEMYHRERIFEHLEKRGATVDARTHRMLAFVVNDAVLQAAETVLRNIEGDYTPDAKAERFPPPTVIRRRDDERNKFANLWKEFCKDRRKDDYKAKKQNHIFDHLLAHLCSDDMSAVTEDDILSWRDKLEAGTLSRKTIRDGYVASVKSFWRRRCGHSPRMCNLYSITKAQDAMRSLFRVDRDMTGNLPPMPGVFPDYPAPIVRVANGERELTMARWGMPSPQFALKGKTTDPGVTNVRNTTSPHWRRWLGPANRCLVPFTSFSEYETGPDGKKAPVWFALGEERPLACFAGIWTNWTSVRKAKEGEVTADIFAFLTTDANSEVAPIHPKAMPVIQSWPRLSEQFPAKDKGPSDNS